MGRPRTLLGLLVGVLLALAVASALTVPPTATATAVAATPWAAAFFLTYPGHPPPPGVTDEAVRSIVTSFRVTP